MLNIKTMNLNGRKSSLPLTCSPLLVEKMSTCQWSSK